MAGNYPEKDALKGDKRLKEASQNGKARDQAQVATRPRPKADSMAQTFVVQWRLGN